MDNTPSGRGISRRRLLQLCGFRLPDGAPTIEPPRQPRRLFSRRRIVQTSSIGIALGLFMAALPAMPTTVRSSLRQAYITSWNYEETPEDRTNHDTLAQHIQTNYVDTGDNQIDWHEFADIVDHAAHNIYDDDESFRRGIWQMFKYRFRKHLDDTNRYLPRTLINCDSDGKPLYHREQMHHYLGGVTGNEGGWIPPSHLMNNTVGAFYNEVTELIDRRKGWNSGDMSLFAVSRPHRNEFITQGRTTVAPNIRSLLSPKGSSPRQPEQRQPSSDTNATLWS